MANRTGLLIAPHCRDEFQAWQKRRSGVGGAGSALRPLPAFLEQQMARLAKGEIAAERDFRDLLRLSFEVRLDSIRRARTRFRGIALAQFLLRQARQHIPAEPRIVYELAETAQAAVLRHTVASPAASALSVRAAIYGATLSERRAISRQPTPASPSPGV